MTQSIIRGAMDMRANRQMMDPVLASIKFHLFIKQFLSYNVVVRIKGANLKEVHSPWHIVWTQL